MAAALGMKRQASSSMYRKSICQAGLAHRMWEKAGFSPEILQHLSAMAWTSCDGKRNRNQIQRWLWTCTSATSSNAARAPVKGSPNPGFTLQANAPDFTLGLQIYSLSLPLHLEILPELLHADVTGFPGRISAASPASVRAFHNRCLCTLQLMDV